MTKWEQAEQDLVGILGDIERINKDAEGIADDPKVQAGVHDIIMALVSVGKKIDDLVRLLEGEALYGGPFKRLTKDIEDALHRHWPRGT